jgi:hypothetical protein
MKYIYNKKFSTQNKKRKTKKTRKTNKPNKTKKYLQRSGMMRSASINRITQTSKNVYSKTKDIAKKAKDVGQDIATEVGKEQIKTTAKMAINPRTKFNVTSFTPMKKQETIFDTNYTNKLSNIKSKNAIYPLDLDEYDIYKTPNVKKDRINFGEISPEKTYNGNEDSNLNIISPYQKTRELNTVKRNLDFENED